MRSPVLLLKAWLQNHSRRYAVACQGAGGAGGGALEAVGHIAHAPAHDHAKVRFGVRGEGKTGVDPGLQFLDLAEQLGALPLQFLVNSHLLPLRQKEPEATKEPGSDLVVFAT